MRDTYPDTKNYHTGGYSDKSRRKSGGLNTSKTSRYLIVIMVMIAIISMLVGGLIYVLWRSKTLLMFTWFDVLGLRDKVETLRNYANISTSAYPTWVYLSLPQSLWFFSGLLTFFIIWRHDLLRKRYWFIGFAIIGIGFEVGQYFNFIPGSYDVVDLFLLILALVAVILFEKFYLLLERGA